MGAIEKVQTLVVVENPKGLHLKPAQSVVNLASKFKCRILLGRDGQMVDAKSTLGLLALGAAKGTKLRLEAYGEDARDAVQALTNLFEQGFDDEGEGK